MQKERGTRFPSHLTTVNLAASASARVFGYFAGEAGSCAPPDIFPDRLDLSAWSPRLSAAGKSGIGFAVSWSADTPMSLTATLAEIAEDVAVFFRTLLSNSLFSSFMALRLARFLSFLRTVDGFGAGVVLAENTDDLWRSTHALTGFAPAVLHH